MNSLAWLTPGWQQVMPDDHSKLVPLLPIPNRTVKRLRADDSADSRVKVGHRQAVMQGPFSARGGEGVRLSGVTLRDLVKVLKNLFKTLTRRKKLCHNTRLC